MHGMRQGGGLRSSERGAVPRPRVEVRARAPEKRPAKRVTPTTRSTEFLRKGVRQPTCKKTGVPGHVLPESCRLSVCRPLAPHPQNGVARTAPPQGGSENQMRNSAEGLGPTSEPSI